MSRRPALVLVALVLLLGASFSLARNPQAPALEEGACLPSMTLPRLDGEADVWPAGDGKVRLVNLWATWCAPCRRELPSLQALDDALDDQRFEVMAIASPGDPDFIREYLRKAEIRFARHLDLDGRLTKSVLGAASLPQTLLIDAHGRLARRVFGERDWSQQRWRAELEALQENAQPCEDSASPSGSKT
ncbi:MAG: TlpA family protein disulfide reductase [Alphaproteobacteria bacterium]|nr:TlpA family protein disulfide reductase [Alphaproteobacteria bacterium]